MVDDVEIMKIENGYIVEYEIIDPETGMEEEVYIYFSEKSSAILYASEILS
jgi:hypothetical protein